MDLEIAEAKILKLKLFEHLDSKEANISLAAANLLVQLSRNDLQTEYLSMINDLRSMLAEMLQVWRKEQEEKDKGR